MHLFEPLLERHVFENVMGQAVHLYVAELFARVGCLCESHDLVLVTDDVHARDVTHELDPACFSTVGR